MPTNMYDFGYGFFLAEKSDAISEAILSKQKQEFL